uniref:Uncharacterized protein n=1 Tax=Romanomermis culicivorax TaxID=13658 RepID=A0A915KQG8_ROMCU
NSLSNSIAPKCPHKHQGRKYLCVFLLNFTGQWKTLDSVKYNKSCIQCKMSYSTYFDPCIKTQFNLCMEWMQINNVVDYINDNKLVLDGDIAAEMMTIPLELTQLWVSLELVLMGK